MSKEITVENLLGAKDLEKAVSALSFEEGIKLLEELVVMIERGSLPLERSILSYERGALLVEHLRAMLSKAEERLQVLKKK